MLRILFLSFLSVQVNAQITWEAPTIAADSGDLLGVDFTLSGYEEIISSQGTIKFDESVLEYSHVDSFALTSMSSGSFGTTEVNIGLLSFSWYEASLIGQSIPDNEVVVRVFFNVIGNPGEFSSLELIDSPVPVEFIDTAFLPVSHSSVSGSVTITDTTANVSELSKNEMTIFPNPASDWIQIEGTSSGNNLELHWYRLDGVLMRNSSFIVKEGMMIPLDGLKSGMYYLKVGNESIGFETRLIRIL